MLLIGGGSQDTNLSWLAAAADRLGVATECILIDDAAPLGLSWNVADRTMTVGGKKRRADAAFLRYDVFSGMLAGSPAASANAAAWFATMYGYVTARGMFTFNRSIDMATGSKPAMLVLARRAGLSTPATLVSNERDAIDAFAGGAAIAKPVAGGSYVMTLAEALAGSDWADGNAPAPAIVQPHLSYPERRIYRIGDTFFAFDIRAATVDSRLDRNGEIVPMELEALPAKTLKAIRKLTDAVRCDFCAIDMKTDPESGELLFLELNNGPMFAGYDRTCNGAMAEAMVRYLVAGAA